MRLTHSIQLAISLVSLSLSAPIIRLAEAPALLVVFWRVCFSLPLLLGVTLIRREPFVMGWGGLAGAFLALHWITWVVAVQNTTVAHATLILSLGPLWAAVLSGPILQEPISKQQWLGLAIALLGVGCVVTGKELGNHAFYGDMMAFVSSFGWVGYTFVGRVARKRSDFWGYTTSVYFSALVCTLPMILFRGLSFVGYTNQTWLAFAGMAMFPTLIGHGSFNYLLKHIGAARLSLWTLTEPVIAIAIAWACFSEQPVAQVLAGGLITLLGVGYGVYRRSSASQNT